jgi:hypothetical protein
MYFTHNVPVTVTVEVHRPAETGGNPALRPSAGFNIQYDSPVGHKFTEWNVVEQGTGWVKYEIKIPDASFANRNGYDLAINTFGSRQNLIFGAISAKRNDALGSGAQIAQEDAAQSGNASLAKPQ